MSHSVLWSSLSPLFPIAQFIPWSRNKSTWSLVGKHKKGSWSSTEATEKFKVSIRRHLKLKQKHYKWSENHQRLLFRPYTILAVYATTPLCCRSTKTADTSSVKEVFGAASETQEQAQLTEHLLLPCSHGLSSKVSREPGGKRVSETYNTTDDLRFQPRLPSSVINATELVTSWKTVWAHTEAVIRFAIYRKCYNLA